MSDNLNLALVLRFIDQATRPARDAMRNMDRLGQSMERSGRERAAALRGETLMAVGQTAALGAAVYGLVKPAIEMETRMAEISKVVDFDPAGLKELQRGIFELNTSGGIPMTADGIADIIAAAGQAGVIDKALPDDEERRQLLAFAADAARMGVAFDISGDQAGKTMASWRKQMGLSQDEVLNLADAVNHLSNNMAASAPDTVDVIGRVGALAMTHGLAVEEVAALSAAFVQAAPSPEIAATAMKNFTGTLTAGEAMTKRQSKVLKELGIDTEGLARRMQDDARGAILDVMQALSQLPEEERGGAIRQLFGQETEGAIAPLLQNLDALAQAFELVADRRDYAGSMMDEFLRMSGTTEAKITQLKSNLDRLRVETGQQILPEFKAFVEWLGPKLGEVATWVGDHGGLVQLVVGGVGAVAALRLARLGLGWLFADMLILGGRILSLFGPAGLIAGALIGVGALIYSHWDEIIATLREKLGELTDSMEAGGLINVGGRTLAGTPIPLAKQLEGMNRNAQDYPFSGYYVGDRNQFRTGGLRAPAPNTTITNRTEVNVGGITIIQKPGETTDELARRTADYIRRQEGRGAELHDGGAYD